MNPVPKKTKQAGNTERKIVTVSNVSDDGSMLEMLYEPKEKRTGFAVWKDGKCTIEPSIRLPQYRLVPYSAQNNLIKNDVVLLPSEPEDYGSETRLLDDIQEFIHRYVDVTPLFEKIASYYVLLSWVYDRFNELPYLRLRGDPGSTRAISAFPTSAPRSSRS